MQLKPNVRGSSTGWGLVSKYEYTSMFVLQIEELNLDNTRGSTEIEGLTEEYTALHTLSLIKIGLTSLKGFPKLPNLTKVPPLL